MKLMALADVWCECQLTDDYHSEQRDFRSAQCEPSRSIGFTVTLASCCCFSSRHTDPGFNLSRLLDVIQVLLSLQSVLFNCCCAWQMLQQLHVISVIMNTVMTSCPLHVQQQQRAFRCHFSLYASSKPHSITLPIFRVWLHLWKTWSPDIPIVLVFMINS